MHPSQTEDGMPIEFEVWLDGEFIASASGKREDALNEALQYYSKYQNNGDVKLFQVTRTEVPVISFSTEDV
jgi:hypothetical protein